MKEISYKKHDTFSYKNIVMNESTAENSYYKIIMLNVIVLISYAENKYYEYH